MWWGTRGVHMDPRVLWTPMVLGEPWTSIGTFLDVLGTYLRTWGPFKTFIVYFYQICPEEGCNKPKYWQKTCVFIYICTNKCHIQFN